MGNKEEMKKYRCKSSFCVDEYDDDGFLIENSGMVIEKGEIFKLDKSGSTIIGGEIHLDNINGGWLEISKKRLEEFFELAEEK